MVSTAAPSLIFGVVLGAVAGGAAGVAASRGSGRAIMEADGAGGALWDTVSSATLTHTNPKA